MLGKRVVSATILIPIVGVAIFIGDPLFFALVSLVALLAGHEFLQMSRQQGLVPLHLLGLALIALFLVDAQWPEFGVFSWGLGTITLFGLIAQVFRPNRGSVISWSFAIAGAVYIGFSTSHFVKLRALDTVGIWWMVLALMGTWICDTGAYLVGIKFGRHKLAPALSPKKSWEGAVGGLVASVAFVAPYATLVLALPWGKGILLGVLLVIAATVGDLAESAIKRQFGVKDSGNLIPGHGGMLDRIDSLLFVVPLVYYWALYMG